MQYIKHLENDKETIHYRLYPSKEKNFNSLIIDLHFNNNL